MGQETKLYKMVLQEEIDDLKGMLTQSRAKILAAARETPPRASKLFEAKRMKIETSEPEPEQSESDFKAKRVEEAKVTAFDMYPRGVRLFVRWVTPIGLSTRIMG